MKKFYAVILTSLFAAGCASNTEYYAAIDAANVRNAEIAMANAEAERTRMIALAELANTGDETSRVAAILGLAMSGNQTNNAQVRVVTPERPENPALEWARVLAHPLTSIGLGYYGYRTSTQQIRANRDITLGSYDSMVELGTNRPIVGDGFVVTPDSSTSFSVTNTNPNDNGNSNGNGNGNGNGTD